MALLLENHRQSISSSRELSILGARNGEEIIELHRDHQARLVILDVVMPGTPPETICRTFRSDATLRNVSLIVIGTAASLSTVKRCAANRSFLRPLNKEDFLGAVRSLIDVAARKDFRVLVGVRISGTVQSAPFFGRSENISTTGILFSANRALAVGDRPELDLMLPARASSTPPPRSSGWSRSRERTRSTGRASSTRAARGIRCSRRSSARRSCSTRVPPYSERRGSSASRRPSPSML